MSYPLFLIVTTVTVTSSLFSLFPYQASKCPEQFVGRKFCGKVVKCHNSFVYAGFAHVGGRALIVIHVRKTIIHFTHRKTIELYYY